MELYPLRKRCVPSGMEFDSPAFLNDSKSMESKVTRMSSRFAKPMEPSGLRFEYATFLGPGWSENDCQQFVRGLHRTTGSVVERLGSGLQNPLYKFESCRNLEKSKTKYLSNVLPADHGRKRLGETLRFSLTHQGQHRVISCLSPCSVVRFAEMADLVMRHLAKVDQAGSIPVLRSTSLLS